MLTRLARVAQFDIATHWIGRAPAIVAQAAFGTACTGVFILARFAVDVFAPSSGLYALIYPATLIATLFGSWRAGAVTYVSAFGWTWYFVWPHLAGSPLARPPDGPRTIVNALSVLTLLLLADLFRNAVHRAVSERDAAIGELEARDLAMRDLNEGLEREVAERTRELGQTWAVSPDLLSLLNKDGQFESINPAWQFTMGWSASAMRAMTFLDFVHPGDVEASDAAWKGLAAGSALQRFDSRFKRRDGVWRWLSWVIVPEGGKFYGSARDVTEEKEHQANLALAEDALRQSQKLDAIGQLTGGVAHDFNNLLTVIIGSVEMLRKAHLPAERRERYLDAIGSTAGRAAKLTGQLLAFARRQSLDPVLFDAGDSLREVLTIVRTLSGSGVEIDNQVREGDYSIIADKSQFDTAIVNMSINARDAMDGEGRLTISAAIVAGIPAGRSHPAMSGEFVAVTIADTGTGIGADIADRIFEPFFTTKAPGAGTGLGLSQVFGFARQSGGDIRIADVQGGGAAFTLYLPRAAVP